MDSNDQTEILNSLNWKLFEEKLNKYEYHDIEIIKNVKYGIKVAKCFKSDGQQVFDEGMTYTHCDTKLVLQYFNSKLSGPYSLDFIKGANNSPIVVGKILLVSKNDRLKKMRYVIDKRSYNLGYEKLSSIKYKMRLPSLREVFAFVDVFSVQSMSIIDYTNFFRQLPMNKYNSNSCILTKESEGEKSFYYDRFAQMGSRDVPLMAQRLTSAVNYIHNCEDKGNSTCLGYQDDTAIFNVKGDPRESARKFINLSQRLGLEVRFDKCIIHTKVGTWLGITYDFNLKVIYPSAKRILSIIELCGTFQKTGYCSLREIQKLLGKISSFSQMNNIKSLIFNLRTLDSNIYEKKQIIFSNCHKLELELVKRATEYLRKGIISFNVIKFLILHNNILELKSLNENQPIILMSELIKKVRQTLPSVPTNINTSGIYIAAVTDSSLSASGGIIITPSKNYIFSYNHDNLGVLTIDKFEAITVIIAGLITLRISKSIAGIIFYTDSEITRYIIKNGNAKSIFLQKLTTLLAFYMNKECLWYSIIRISTIENQIADNLSRNKRIVKNIDVDVIQVEQQIVLEMVDLVKRLVLDTSYYRFLDELMKLK